MRSIVLILLSVIGISAQTPPIEPGVSHELAKWRAARYSDVRYKLNLTLEKMSPVLKGTIEIRVNISPGIPSPGTSLPGTSLPGTQASSPANAGSSGVENLPIILDWRKIRGSESLSTIAHVELNGTKLYPAGALQLDTPDTYREYSEHLVFNDRVRVGENVIKLDFTSPILTSGSAITRYVDKEDGAEYIYSLFVPSDASTAFPVFDQPDLKARFGLFVSIPEGWVAVSNTEGEYIDETAFVGRSSRRWNGFNFKDTQPISTYVFAFAAGRFEAFDERTGEIKSAASRPTSPGITRDLDFSPRLSLNPADHSRIYVRKSQAAKFKPHAAEVFRLNREGIKYLEQYFDYKFPFPKYDLVLIPEFPFGGMEHAGATFLREASIIFPQEPTKGDYISRANLIFHEAAHQWFGDTVTMKWFDDLWLKEGFAEFMAYKTLEKVMPDANAWKVFYERNKQAAYLTDSTRGTTPIYQEIANLNAAKSAYGNIVYRKAPSFLRQAEFYLGEDKFQTAVRAFLKKHEYANAGWEDLVKEFEAASGQDLGAWANTWVKQPGLPIIRTKWGGTGGKNYFSLWLIQSDALERDQKWIVKTKVLSGVNDDARRVETFLLTASESTFIGIDEKAKQSGRYYAMPNYEDYGYGIFLLDDKSRDYVLKNIQNEKDPFLRSMMWGSLWDSVREGELDPKEYVELAIRNLPTEKDETIVASILGRVATAMSYYLSLPPLAPGIKTPPATAGGTDLHARLEAVLLDRLQNAPTAGQQITFYRAFVANATTAKGREVLKQMLKQSVPPAVAGGVLSPGVKAPVATAPGTDKPATAVPLRTKDRFDIVTRLIILGDPDALRLLSELEKAETSDDAKRYAYAARAGIPTAENKAKYWNDFTNNKEISESWIEAAFGPWNSIRHADLTLPYLERALKELPNHKRNRKIFFVNGWLAAFIGGQRSEQALATVNKFLADNPALDRDLSLKILENVDLIERAVRIRGRYK